MTEEIRTIYGIMLGKIQPTYGGKLEARSFYGKLLGTYDPNTNETRDFYGKLLAKGNILSFLICNEAGFKP